MGVFFANRYKWIGRCGCAVCVLKPMACRCYDIYGYWKVQEEMKFISLVSSCRCWSATVVLMLQWWCSCCNVGAHAAVVVLMLQWWCSCCSGGAHAAMVVLICNSSAHLQQSCSWLQWWCSSPTVVLICNGNAHSTSYCRPTLWSVDMLIPCSALTFPREPTAMLPI